MMRGATSSCLFIFICSMAALCESSSNSEGTVTPTVSSSSNTSFTSSTSLSSSDSTSPGESTFLTTNQSSMAIGTTSPESRSSTESGNPTSSVSSSTTVLTPSKASVPIVTPTNLASEASANASTVEAMTTALHSTVETTNFSVNQTNMPVDVASSIINTTQPTSVTDDVTQGSTIIPTTIATTLNASSNLTTASVSTNITVPTTNGTTVVDASNTTTVTMTVNITLPVNTTGLSTDVPHSSWSTQSQKTSTTHSTVQCQHSTCPPGSKCVELYQSHTCRCPIGQFMQSGNCVTVRTFPGTLHLTMDFEPGMNDVRSKIFLNTSRRIEEEMKKFFKNDSSYYQSIVWKLEKGSVKASIDNIFSLSSEVTEEFVNQRIKNGIKTCLNCTTIKDSDNYTSESICKRNVCDVNTSNCTAINGTGECSCLPGYNKFADSDRSCKACPSGLKLRNGSCVKCPFGYSGFNCDKSYLLALVVVSCVLGGILLLLLLALMGICLRLRSGAYSSSSSSHDYIMWPKSEMPKIPRATMHWDGNQLEMQENGSTSSLNDIHREGGRMPEKNDDLKTFKGKQQSRYTYLCQGQENPYYVSDEKKPEYL
ncbi:protein HEG-like [Hypanus sabinus]|uniref:protein HEG-like n=1 Tax=Hypanus sabinus TaxID=79690 RepID=UPI0028C412EA|nr:protein HEG-like [Hypanus sabinus]